MSDYNKDFINGLKATLYLRSQSVNADALENDALHYIQYLESSRDSAIAEIERLKKELKQEKLYHKVDCDNYREEVEHLKDLLRWRTVEKDGLPDEEMLVLTFNREFQWNLGKLGDDGDGGIGWVMSDGRLCRDFIIVTHWLPISKPEDV